MTTTHSNSPLRCFKTTDGLQVNVIQKPGYQQTVATLSVKMGASTDTWLDESGKRQKIPAGTAHFLEHKLFDKPDGDVLIDFTNLGADANAFTTNDQTCYYFSSDQQVEEALELLLHFVQEPYFTDQTVARERGIIEEEIASYQDDPFSILYQGILKTAYPATALAEDVAGTAASLQAITPSLLYAVHQAFYQPENLTLTIVSALNFDRVMNWVNRIQGSVSSRRAVQQEKPIAYPLLSKSVQVAKAVAVQRPKLALLKPLPIDKEMSLPKQRLLAEIALDLAFGEQTDWYQTQYQSGQLGDDFDYEVLVMESAAFVLFFSSGTTDKQGAIIQKRLNDWPEILRDSAEDFVHLQKALIGENLLQQDRLEQVALDDDLALYGVSLFDKMKILTRFEHADVLNYAKTALKPGPLAQFTLKKLR
ncbi:insulinase family protein [Fructobacillus sp. M158]|uniref:EF-P 5-aminopentanol modification-associated protein YfmH n=1 Tax=Fructobacillus parabroussonetiae TaxID=2713174 RepID=UPI00200B3322|nr:pitrilysin family protein [Fructobacillus parabroussonetiae]MCK8617311.1 insulinase family protein [Fructobacillus parabroussonetiae]